MNSLLVFLVRPANTASLAAHLMAGLAALIFLVGTSAQGDAKSSAVKPAVVQLAPADIAKNARVSHQVTQAKETKRVDLPLAAVTTSRSTRP